MEKQKTVKQRIPVGKDSSQTGDGDAAGVGVNDDNRKSSESRIFEEHRTLGQVSNHVPCTLRYIHTRRENFIATCTGKSIITFAGQQLKQVSIGGNTADDILCMASDVYHIYTGVGKKIFAWRRGTELKHTFRGRDSDVQFITVIASLLVSLDKDGDLCVHDIKSEELISKVRVGNSSFHPTCVVHPHGFVNKILVGSSEGKLQLWNFNSMKLIHQFDSFTGAKINHMVTGKVFGVVAIALSSKKVVLHNLEFDETIVTLECLDEPVSLGFHEVPMNNETMYVIAGGMTGSVSAWDLQRKELVSYQKFAHQASVTGLVAFESEPLFVTTSSDNSVKAWIFDKPDGGFRLLNSREGNRLPPTTVRFHGEQNLCVLTSGEDKCLRSFHLHNETYNRTISNFVPRSEDEDGRGIPVDKFVNAGGNHKPLAEDILSFSTPNSGIANSFHYENAKKGNDLKLRGTPEVTCAYLTSDNEWGVIGYATGSILKFNMQSKIKRAAFDHHHRGEITGLFVDSNGEYMASGSGGDKHIMIWEFKSGDYYGAMSCSSPVQSIFSRPVSNLFGAILTDFTVLVCDLDTTSIIRSLEGCTQPVTAACFSPDMKWVTASTVDGCIRTWDVPTGNLIDIFRLADGIMTSLDYSPRGEYFASTISGQLGVTLWINQSMYDHVSLLPIPLTYIPGEPQPSPVAEADMEVFRIGTSEPPTVEFMSLKPLVERAPEKKLYAACDTKDWLIDLGFIPPVAVWTDLLNMDENKKRNKPADSFTKTQVIPFLLHKVYNRVEGAEPKESLFKKERSQGQGKTLPTGFNFETNLSPFGTKLRELDFDVAGNCRNIDCAKELISTLERMGPSQIDLEIQSLSPDQVGSKDLLLAFLKLLVYMTRGKQYFQISQMCLLLYLHLYEEELQKDRRLQEELNILHSHQEEVSSFFQQNITVIKGLMGYNADEYYNMMVNYGRQKPKP